MRRALLFAMGIAFAAPSFAGADPISDSELAASAEALFASTETPADRLIGLHKGLLVIIDVRCGGQCPANTIRILHYVGDADRACQQTSGDLITLNVPRGLVLGPEKFCIPHVLANRKTYADKPFQ